MTVDAHTIVGRRAEVEALGTFIDSIEHGPAMLVVAGDAGIGKSTIWREGLRLADGRGFEVLRCRPVESEAQLAFTGLSDLLAEVPLADFEGLPVPQRRALEVALLRAEPEGDEFFPRAVALGVLGLLAARASTRPVVLGVDDAQWLDHASRRVLAFVVRRLRRERVGLLIAGRPEAGPTMDDDLGDDPDIEVSRLRLTALDEGDLERILRSRLGQGLGRRSLTRLQQSSGGNPLFALQLGRALLERGDDDGGLALPVSSSLQQVVGDRLVRLGPAISVVQAAAAVSRPSTGLIAELFGDEVGSDGIRAAVDAGVLAVDGERIAFTHPVLATAAYAQLSDHDRRQLHSRLATLLDDVEERARHLAMATAHPDADVAGALDSAARRARARCAPDAAAELWDAAARLSPSDQADAARGRRLEAAQCWFEAGEVERARAMFEDILRGAPPGRVRARTLARLSWAVAHIDGFEAGSQAFRAALVELGDDVAAEIEVQQGLVWCLHSASGVASAEPHAQRALVLAERSGDPRLIGGAVTHVAFLRSLAGHGLAVDDVARAVERAAAGAEVSERSPILGRPEWIHGMLLEWQDRLGEAHDCFRRLHRQAIDIGDEQSLPFILFQMARTELLMGDWTQARRSAEVCAETTHNSGQASERPYACAITALVDAHLGSVDAARAGIAEGLALSRRFGVRPAALEMLATQGFLDLSLGRYEAADRALTEVAARAEESGLREPALFRYHGDAIEAKVALGRLDEAAALLAGARELAERLARPWMEMVVARGSGLLEAAGGGLDSAGELLTSSLGDDRVGQPFERARTLLVLGSVQRRNRKKRPARDALCAAADIFRGLGAQLWVDRAEAESARIGGRPPVAGLTPTELRVAELIAAGRTYREAGAELFISPKTVQWNLSKVYSKLGIRSRAELPGRLQGG